MAALNRYLFGLQGDWPKSMGLQDLDRDESRQTHLRQRADTEQTCLVKASLALLSRSYVFCIGPAALGGPHFALSHQPQGQVRQGGQVAAGAHRSLLRDKGEA